MHHQLTYCTALNLKPVGNIIEECETDLLVINANPDGVVEILIGECKANDVITDDDVRKLSLVARALKHEQIHSYILFSKTGSFSPDEIELCKTARGATTGGVILLSGRELEPYIVYERAAKQFAMDETCVCLKDMVEATGAIYFEPRPLPKPAPGSSRS